MFSIKSIFLIGLSIFIFNGCATTGFNYDKKQQQLVLTNNDKKIIISNVKLDNKKYRYNLIEPKGNLIITRYKSDSKYCKRINIYEYQPLSMNSYYLSNVEDNIKEVLNQNNIEKKDNFYIATNKHKILIAYESGSSSGMGPSEKTLIEMKLKCWNNSIENSSIKYNKRVIDENHYNKLELEEAIKIKKYKAKKLYNSIEKYKIYSSKKAMAFAIDKNGRYAFGRSYSYFKQDSANKRALKECKKYKSNYDVKSECTLYSIGDKIVADIKQKNLILKYTKEAKSK